MRLTIYLFVLLFLNICFSQTNNTVYEANWSSINARPLPGWYDDVKFGIFIHFGVYSVPAFSQPTGYAEWYWYNLMNPSNDGNQTLDYHTKSFGKNFPYQSFAEMLNLRLFDPDEWAQTIYDSGARYVVLTSKHHEGFTLWESEQSWGWNSVNIGPQIDIVGALSKSVKEIPGMHMGVYHSLYEWFNPIYLDDLTKNPPTQVYVNEILQPQLRDVVNSYEPEVIWADGDWEALSSYWESTEFLAWLYTNSTVKDTVVVNDRWGSDCRMKNGGFWTGGDKTNPGYLIPHKWENCNTIGYSYGYNQNEPIYDYQNSTVLIQEMIETVSCGGNYLLDIGPTSEGTIPMVMQERLADIGKWMDINGEAIYSTHPWRVQNDSADHLIWYTTNTNTGAVYAHSFEWPESGKLLLNAPIATSYSSISLLGYKGKLPIKMAPTGGRSGISITLPNASPNDYPPFDIFVFKLLNVL
ncbi:Alpha-L-fucosidase precursor [Tieghemostelium lacteum]|uniref:alpha-L-fucosidase n=1 Tax=Tieghemostelium lacteum TaxID=361077 RepID=A0A151Z3D0_TIELA|nr:Alpha-L-fucosidase precursor [Tieghemostelium lacteum]|eukprot:KYQ88455.1 Alpha-L-fucosidase precursor [Tieghemostelium lacteum]